MSELEYELGVRVNLSICIFIVFKAIATLQSKRILKEASTMMFMTLTQL
jgi:hypothetical protein